MTGDDGVQVTSYRLDQVIYYYFLPYIHLTNFLYLFLGDDDI